MPQKRTASRPECVGLISMIGLFAVVWPFASMWLIDAFAPPYRCSWSSQRLIGGIDCACMMAVGLPVGIQIGLLLDRFLTAKQTLIPRTVFLLLSSLFALIVVGWDSCLASYPRGQITLHEQCYHVLCLVLMQAVPLLWFSYNLHGETWQRIYAHRRRRTA